MRRFRCLTLSDFNVATFEAYLANDPSAPEVEAVETAFGQVESVLANPDASEWAREPDFAVIWTRPEGVIPGFRRLLEGESVKIGEMMREVDEYIERVAGVVDRVRFVFVPTWTLPANRSSFASLEMEPGQGAYATLLRMNLRLVERLGEISGLHVLNGEAWMRSSRPYSPKLWYLSKTPFASEVFRRAMLTIKAALRGISGESRKLIVLDLDNTLWGGIVGEVGWERLELGGHDPIGESFVDFQRALKALTRRGMLLGIVSKNEETVALDAIRSHPEMVLRLDDFAGWKIDWQDKAQNLADLVRELNLGLQSVVFLDDNPAERARVAEALPEVLVPDWPADRLLYRQALEDLDCFDNPVMTDEDRERTTLYAVERHRQTVRGRVDSLEEWLETLETTVVVEPLTAANLARATQLLNKTNQMNLSTRRMSDAELMRWAEAENHAVWTFRVADRFGDAGLTGLVGFEGAPEWGRIVDFVLSCRIFGRKVEETMLAVAVRHARGLGLPDVRLEYLPTARNRPCLDFLRRSGLSETDVDEDEGMTFRWLCDSAYPFPPQIRLFNGVDRDPEADAGWVRFARGIR
jgi:FkbH-like protein